MPFHADIVTLTLIGVLAVIVVGILVYAAVLKQKARRRQRDSAAIRSAIVDYFRRSGVGVSVECARVNEGAAFTAMIESEPMKRFRLSHIIEMTVREHVRKSCGLELDKIYWRFPIKEAAKADSPQAAAQAAEAAVQKKADDPLSDDYINEGLEHYRHIPKPEVEELPWESFEQAATGGKPPADTDPQQ